jgi:hypothetical protein
MPYEKVYKWTKRTICCDSFHLIWHPGVKITEQQVVLDWNGEPV